MKRLIITSILACIACVCYGQSLGYRKDNARCLAMGTDYSAAGRQLGVSLNYCLDKATNEELWRLDYILSSQDEPLKIDRGAKLLIRTFSGTVVEMKQNRTCYELRLEKTYREKDYLVYPEYYIDGGDLLVIMNEGIQKMRFETTKGMKDLQWEDDVYGRLIRSEYNLILGI